MNRLSSIRMLSIAVTLLSFAGTARADDPLQAVTSEGSPADLELVEERVVATIDRQYLQATLRQVYRNPQGVPLEGRYRLQLGDGGTVRGFSYWNGEEKIVGEVFERDTAAGVYEEVTGIGRDPGLLESEGEGTFTFRVFPIAPGERKPVEVEVGAYLSRLGNTVAVRLPTYSATAEIELELGDERGIRDVRSSTHHIDLERRGEGRVVVRSGAPKGAAVDAFALEYTLGDAPWHLAAVLHRDPGQDGYVQLSLATPASVDASAVSAKDVTIVLDRSGSMAGEPLEHARRAAVDVIRRLRPQDRVNVVAFDDGVDPLFSVPQRLTAEVRAKATDFVERLRDSGGTNIAGALEVALASQVGDLQPDIVLFLTDGQSDRQTALEVAQKIQSEARVFTIGVGSGVERALLSRLAATRRGRFTYIESASAIPARIERLYAQIESPLLVDLELDVEGATLLRTYPRSLPDLFVGDELRLAARVRGTGNAKVVLTGMREGKPVRYEATVELAAQAQRPWVGRLWGEARVADLLDEIALFGETTELRDEATELALAYDLVTPFTSFLAIPQSELTEGAAETLAQARARKQAILAAHPDAVALSRSAMPPGDPIVTVRAPADARQVTAYFPFGLVKDLAWDPELEHWTTRFLVPNTEVDGDYEVEVVIVRADGTTELAKVLYTIDSRAEALEVHVTPRPGGATVQALGRETLREVVLMHVEGGTRVQMQERVGLGGFAATLELDPGIHTLRLVGTDAARNEVEQTLTIEVSQ